MLFVGKKHNRFCNIGTWLIKIKLHQGSWTGIQHHYVLIHGNKAVKQYKKQGIKQNANSERESTAAVE